MSDVPEDIVNACNLVMNYVNKDKEDTIYVGSEHWLAQLGKGVTLTQQVYSKKRSRQIQQARTVDDHQVVATLISLCGVDAADAAEVRTRLSPPLPHPHSPPALQPIDNLIR